MELYGIFFDPPRFKVITIFFKLNYIYFLIVKYFLLTFKSI